MPRLSWDLKSGCTISYISGEPGSGCGDVGQQEVPWDSEGLQWEAVLKARREGKGFGELGRAKYKVCEATEETV